MSGNISDSENELKIYRFKILMIGDQRVGKSAICQQLCNSTHVQTYKETYGCDFYLKEFSLASGIHVHLNIWDIGYQGIMDRMMPTYLFNTNCILFVYDITKKDSFFKLNNLLKLIPEKSNILTGLIGNKTDLYHLHEVKMPEHAQFSEKNKMKSFFMSAKTADQIIDCFLSLSEDLTGFKSDMKIGKMQGGVSNVEHIDEKEENSSEEEGNPKNNNEKIIKENSSSNLPQSKKQENQTRNSFNNSQNLNNKDDMSKMVMGSKKSKNCNLF